MTGTKNKLYCEEPEPVCLTETPGSVGQQMWSEYSSLPEQPVIKDVRGPVDASNGFYKEVGQCSIYDAPPPKVQPQQVQLFINNIFIEIDKIPELTGSGVLLQYPQSDPVLIRASNHASGKRTYVEVKMELKMPSAPERSWWDQYNGVVLNCTGAAISWIGVAASSAAEVPTVGGATPLVILSYTAATATTAQCLLAVGKEASEDFERFIQSPEGEWINMADVALDIISLAGGVTGAIQALKSSGKLLQTSKYAKMLDSGSKSKLIKQLGQMEKLEKDVKYFKEATRKLIAAKKVQDPVSRGMSNNLVKRALPLITKSLKQEQLAGLSDVIAASFTTTASYYGGVGSESFGLVKVSISVIQDSI